MPRKRRSTTPKPRRYAPEVIEYFWAHVENGPVQSAPELGPCLLWTGALTAENYPIMRFRGLSLDPRPWAYRYFVGPIPSATPTLDHLCHSWASYCAGGRTCPHRPCVHPQHHEPVTYREQSRRIRTPNPYTGNKFPPKVMWATCRNDHPWSKETIAYDASGKRFCADCEEGLY